MTEETRYQIKEIVILVLIAIVGTVFMYEIVCCGKDHKDAVTYKSKLSADSLTIDSLKMKITHDSLAHVDSLRALHIKKLNNKDDANKKKRDDDHAIVKYATDEQLDSLWSIYSPKINH